jgi:hypothetical protein
MYFKKLCNSFSRLKWELKIRIKRLKLYPTNKRGALHVYRRHCMRVAWVWFHWGRTEAYLSYMTPHILFTGRMGMVSGPLSGTRVFHVPNDMSENNWLWRARIISSWRNLFNILLLLNLSSAYPHTRNICPGVYAWQDTSTGQRYAMTSAGLANRLHWTGGEPVWPDLCRKSIALLGHAQHVRRCGGDIGNNWVFEKHWTHLAAPTAMRPCPYYVNGVNRLMLFTPTLHVM